MRSKFRNRRERGQPMRKTKSHDTIDGMINDVESSRNVIGRLDRADSRGEWIERKSWTLVARHSIGVNQKGKEISKTSRRRWWKKGVKGTVRHEITERKKGVGITIYKPVEGSGATGRSKKKSHRNTPTEREGGLRTIGGSGGERASGAIGKESTS